MAFLEKGPINQGAWLAWSPGQGSPWPKTPPIPEKPLLRYMARVYATTEGSVRQALETTRPQRAQELNMTVAEEWIERGRQQTLLRLIERKFGPQARKTWQSRVEEASVEELTVAADRILEAQRVEDLFS